MKKIFVFLVFLLLFLYPIPNTLYPSFADEIEDLQKQINELSSAREQSVKATKPLEGQLDLLKRQLSQIQAQLDHLSASIKQKENDLEIREEKAAQKQAVMETRVRSFYIRSFFASPLLVILSSGSSGDLFRELAFRQSAAKEDRNVIISVTEEIKGLLIQKEKLEKDKASLAFLQAQVDKNAQFLGGEVSKAKEYQSQLSSKIAQLTALQQSIISQRLAALNISRSAASIGACVDDRNKDPGFSPALAFFTYGVPNRVGMNQFGAKGRAEAGQSYEDILKAYYQNFSFEQKPNINISVAGFGSIPLETYLLGIYEMPDSFPMEALKAQVIAARSYSLAYTGSGEREICTSEQCQVYKGGNKGGNWEQAVKATEGKTMMTSGSPMKAWYSSTHGGYIFSSDEIGWSATSWTKHGIDTSSSVGSFSDLQANAYDKESPWFYCDWGSRSQYNKTAWLRPEEVTDIVNVILLARADSGTANHLFQTDKPNPAGTDTWDGEKVKVELKNRGQTPFNSVSDVSVGWDQGAGRTTQVNVSGDAGSVSFSGSEFKNYFNLRAPANIQIVGPLFNVERK